MRDILDKALDTRQLRGDKVLIRYNQLRLEFDEALGGANDGNASSTEKIRVVLFAWYASQSLLDYLNNWILQGEASSAAADARRAQAARRQLESAVPTGAPPGPPVSFEAEIKPRVDYRQEAFQTDVEVLEDTLAKENLPSIREGGTWEMIVQKKTGIAERSRHWGGVFTYSTSGPGDGAQWNDRAIYCYCYYLSLIHI